MLIKDVEDGIGQTMMPRQLWESRVEYQAFPYDFFVNVFMRLGKRDLLGLWHGLGFASFFPLKM